MYLRAKHPHNLLQWFIKADGGGTVEDDVNVFSQGALIRFA